MAWLSGYTTRRRIVISHANVDADLTAFPVYVRLRSTNFNFAESTANGHDIRFTAADGVTLLNFERERHDQAGQLADYMVRIPTLFGAVDTEIFVYFRTTTNTDLSAPNAVWDANTVSRWSLSENPAGTAPQMRDSTANNNHGTTEGAMTSGQSVEGSVGRALNFDGSNDFVTTTLNPSTELGQTVTLEAWVFPRSQIDNRGVMGHHTGAFMGISGFQFETSQWVLRYGNGTAWESLKGIGTLALNTWTHLVGVISAGAGGTVRAYVNGLEHTPHANVSTNISHLANFNIGRTFADVNRHFDGLIDDARVSNIARSPAWIKAAFHSGNNSLLTVQATEQAAFFVYTGLSPVIAHSSFVQALSQNITGLSPIITMPDAPYVQALNYAGISPVVAVTRADNVFRYVRNGLTALEVAPSHILIASLPNVYEHFSSLFVTGHLSDLTQIAYGYAGQSIVFTAPIADRIFSHRIIGDGVFVVDFSGEVTISRLETNEFRFAGIPSSQYHVKMLKSPILVLPGTRDKILTIPGRHGTIRMPHDWQERTIQIECWLAASSMQELHDKLDTLRAWLGQGQQRLTLGYMPDRYYIATFAGGALEAEIKAHQGLFSLEFVCAEPFAYDIVPDVVTITTTSHQHNQRGTAPAKPLLVLRGQILPGQQISITNGTRTIVYTGLLATNEQLEIDCDTMSAFRVVSALRTNVISQIATAAFPVLEPGLNTITITPAGGATWSQLEIQCRNRWL